MCAGVVNPSALGNPRGFCKEREVVLMGIRERDQEKVTVVRDAWGDESRICRSVGRVNNAWYKFHTRRDVALVPSHESSQIVGVL